MKRSKASFAFGVVLSLNIGAGQSFAQGSAEKSEKDRRLAFKVAVEECVKESKQDKMALVTCITAAREEIGDVKATVVIQVDTLDSKGGDGTPESTGDVKATVVFRSLTVKDKEDTNR